MGPQGPVGLVRIYAENSGSISSLIPVEGSRRSNRIRVPAVMSLGAIR